MRTGQERLGKDRERFYNGKKASERSGHVQGFVVLLFIFMGVTE